MDKEKSQSIGAEILGGVVFAAFFIFLLIYLGWTTTIKCARNENERSDCTWQSKWLFIPWSTWTANSVIGSSIEENDSGLYRVLLNTDNGSMPLTSAYSCGESFKRKTVDRINDFLTNSDARVLEIREYSFQSCPDGFSNFAMFFIFVLISLIRSLPARSLGKIWGRFSRKMLHNN